MSSELIYRGHDAQPPTSGAGYSAKPEKRMLWLSRALRYLLREQRLLFLLVGMAFAALVLAFARTSPAATGGARLMMADPWSMAVHHHGHNHRAEFEVTRGFVGGKVPLGLKRKGLRIVVTGGAGFVGSHLVDRLMARGDSVIVVDNFFTGRKQNLMHHFGNPNFELIRHDVVEPLLLEVDQIYHLACPASPVHYKFNPVKTIISFLSSLLFPLGPFKLDSALFRGSFVRFLLGCLLNPPAHKTNVVGTLNMLGLAKRVGARFLLTSTSEVYGDPLQHPQVETYWGNVNPIGVRSCYDEGKRTAETLTMDYHRGAQVEVRIARIFNTYGPRMCIDDGRVVSNFVAQALRKEPMTVYGDGKQTRSFQYVSDLVEGLIRLMEGSTWVRSTWETQGSSPCWSWPRIARIFNTYGPRMCIDDGRVVSNFVAQALRKEPMTVYGDGKQTRSFQYVSDLVEGLIRLMEGEHVGPFNLGNPGEFTMLELAKVVQETIDPNASIEFRPNTEDDPHKRKPDITRAKELLNWEPKISLRQGLPLMVSDFRNRIFGDHSDNPTSATATGSS
ncbi:hypothetical protein C4D60_Mb09t14940 [Musa balbisiana]|uniref:UDP-glucuronate decarboxylase n=2 Tax=Magnoliopsida TaxID=3398 RepID=A0A4V4H393_MUSBA|nr:hypothetical protein C4D60_Mb09t14940 [Musa balbisiana]